MRFFRRNSFAVLGGLAVCWTLGAQAAPIAQLRFSFELNGGPVTTIVDGGPGDTDGVINGSIVLGTITPIPGYTVFGSVTSSDGTINDGGLLAGFNVLDSGATKVVNRSGGPVHVQAAFSAYGFTPWANVAFSTGSGTFEVSNGAPITLKYYDDPNNAWGASTPFDTPGNLIDTYSFTASGVLSSFAHNGGPFGVNDNAPFSMTETFDFTLPNEGTLVSRGQGESKLVPEPASLWILGLGLAALGIAAPGRVRRSRRPA